MPITLGSVPDSLVVQLAYGGDFLQTLEAPYNWDNGVVIALHFSTALNDPVGAYVWPATISGVFAAWDVVAATVTSVITAGALYVRLVYTDASGDVMVWATGRANVT